ncbi:MATE family efflux transporter [Pseudovibrio sp. SPO723]|uniref:MATE family efflux transporter n=1 Tax=Nesiotobacter zosterae TaxID=392721 RepID=UPI0029C4B622|nr:MATE family efflux transporter [Pseudovibrio sp. SPO723]MDX5593005.1 MATE family efflux transporter [Pseudovibrio sp. SPO723]
MTSPSPAARSQAKFTQGSTMHHVLVMTSTGSIGLVAIFIVDFANLFYISQLGVAELAAAIGYAGTIMFFNTAVGIGLSIAASATVSRRLGAGDAKAARRMAGVALAASFTVACLMAAALFPILGDLIAVLGASGPTYDFALGYLQIVVPSMPLLCMGMVLSALLRAVGDAKRAMYLTLLGGVIIALLDPVFIFLFGLGIDGAAIVSVLSRVAMVAVGLWATIHIHNLLGKPELLHAREDLKALMAVALPAVLTNVATPVGNAWVTMEIAAFGDEAVAGWAIVGRVIPVAFGALFALSGAVGPILGQNLGAGLFDRLNRALKDALIFVIIYSLLAWALLFLLQEPLAYLFNATGDSRDLLAFFCTFAAAGFLFNAALFVTNAAFNNLGFPLYSTLFNWGRATLGTIPFTWVGGAYFGANGVLAGQAIGGVLFAIAAQIICWRVLAKLRSKNENAAVSSEAATADLPADALQSQQPIRTR